MVGGWMESWNVKEEAAAADRNFIYININYATN